LKISTRIISMVSILLLGICLAVSGCQTAQKPVSPTPNKNPHAITPQTQSYPQRIANDATSEAVKVSGVRTAYAVVSGRNIYVGLELSGNGMNSAQIEKNVADRVKQARGGFSVSVTSDKNTVALIKKTARGIAAGTPLSSFKGELNTLDQRLKSTLR
jgi:YhcN/YlaJ family sporulation lipoprotein